MAILRRSAAGRSSGISPFRAGLIAIVLVVVASYFAYTQANPFADPFELKAAFNTVNNLKPDSPVRIAGVEVGTVTEVQPLATVDEDQLGDDAGVAENGDGAVVTMEIEEHGLPIHEDAELEVRPRIFLEGNEFVDIRPGTPSAPVAEEGYTIPVNQTATPVQFGQVLSVLRSDVREDLRTLLFEYSTRALTGGGARSFNDSIEYWEEAYRNSALANEALLGTQPGDLARVISGQQRTFAALSADPEALQDLVVNFNTTAAAFAREDDALEATIPALRDVLKVGRPALASLNSSFPGIQRFAVDALPGVRSSQVTVPESFPFIRQLRLLFQPSELRGLAADLRKTIPPLARLNKRTIGLLNQNRALSACTNNVLLPFSRTPIPTGDPDPNRPNRAVNMDFPFAPDSTMQPFYKQGARAFVGLSGESRATDANNEFFRANFKVNLNPLQFFRPGPNFLGSPTLGDRVLSLSTPEERSRPAPPPTVDIPGSPLEEYRRTPFRPDFPCEQSVKPDLRAPSVGPDPSGSPVNLLPTIIDLLPLRVQRLASGSQEQQVEALVEVVEALETAAAEDEGAQARPEGDAAQPGTQAKPGVEGQPQAEAAAGARPGAEEGGE